MGLKIYHYTKDTYIENILNKKNLRATASTQSNDLVDTIYISELLGNCCEKFINKVVMMDDYIPKQDKEIIVANLTTVLNKLFHMYCDDRKRVFGTKAKAEKCFVICFSSKDDSRFLWEAYSKNKGINICFDLDDLDIYLKNYKTNQYSGYEFKKVIYKKTDQLNLLYDILKRNYEKYFKYQDNVLSPYSLICEPKITYEIIDGDKYTFSCNKLNITLKKFFTDFLQETCRELLYHAPFIKHPYWMEEDEYRLVLYRPYYHDNLETLSYNKKTNSYYIELNISSKLIKGLKISPLSKYTISDFEKYKKAEGYVYNTNYSIGKNVLTE